MSAAAAQNAAPGIRTLPAARLKEMLADGGELALLDVREELVFSEAHLLHARSTPLSRLELRVPALVPRRSARVVLVDGGDGLAGRAAQILRSHGYTDLCVLEGGIDGWTNAGCVLFSGMHVPSKAFGEVVEHSSGTPNVDAAALKRMLDSGEDVVVLDSRPFDEYTRMSIPTGRNVPGAELVLRVADLAPSPRTTVVVNCAGRTRSIIGAQSLIDAGVPNKVVALRNGTMGWTLAGFTPDRGKDRRTSAAPPSARALAWAKKAAERVAQRSGLGRIDVETLARWRGESDSRTLCVFDVRDPREYEAGHLPGTVSAPGGQLVQATDQYVGTLNSRIVLVDELEVRALMTGSWLRQMGWKDVFVLAASGNETGWPAAPVLGLAERPDARLDPAALAAFLERRAATVIDLSLSREYKKGHIPGGWFAIRSRLDRAISKIEPVGSVVLTSEDGILAALALDEMRALTAMPVRYLGGGNVAWIESGRALTAEEPRLADEPLDVWLKPYDRSSGQAAAMQDYLAWEVDLVERIERDGSCNFRPIAAAPAPTPSGSGGRSTPK